MDIDTIFVRFGGPTKFGEAIGVSRTHAATMKTRRSIPSEYWQRLVSGAKERGIEGITFESLAAIAAARKSGQVDASGAAA